MLTYNIEIDIVMDGQTVKVPAVVRKSEDSVKEGETVADKTGRLDMEFKDSDSTSYTIRIPRKEIADILRMVDGVNI